MNAPLLALLRCVAALSISAPALSTSTFGHETPEVGAALERIHCPEGYSARVHASELEAPDGLAFDARGRVCVVEESAGRVTRIDRRGAHVTLARGLRSPEGLCLGPRGRLLVVEDRADGRLLSIGARGELEELAAHLDAPEGVTLLGETIYVSESSAQFADSLFSARTGVRELRRAELGWGPAARILERGLPFSFSELLADGRGHLILANEVAGGSIQSGLLRLELASGELEVFARGLVSPEGLCWTPGETPGFPLYVAEENVDGQGHGRLSRVDSEGRRTTFATGFGTLEDVLVGGDGRIYVSEDSTGLLIELRPR